VRVVALQNGIDSIDIGRGSSRRTSLSARRSMFRLPSQGQE
jgi:hypothetical protein